MSRPKAILTAIVAFVVLVIAAGMLVLRLGTPEGPQLRVVEILPASSKDRVAIARNYSSLLSGMREIIPEETWFGCFEIRFPQESGSTLAMRDIPYEIYGAENELIEKGFWKSPNLPPVLNLRLLSASPRLILSEQARRVRFAIRYRPPTPRARIRMLLHKHSFGTRYPEAATSISNFFPDRERWLDHVAEISLPPFPPRENP